MHSFDRLQQTRLTPGIRLRRIVAVLCLLTAGLTGSMHAAAWGPLGHKLAGEIAARYLDPQTRRQVQALIGNESIADASGWADRMRDDPSDFWQREAGAYHYVTVPEGRRYQDVRPPRKGDGLTALSEFREQVLDDSLPREQRALALRFAIHIVQDLHQPLHVGNGRDRGGNDVELRVDGKRSNLHRLWDSQVLYSAGRSDRQWLAFFDRGDLLRTPVTEDADPFLWVQESASLRDSLYPAPKDAGKSYMQRQLPRAEIRLALAGIRTAAWLNATLGGPTPGPRRTDASDAGTRPGPSANGVPGDGGQSWWEDLFKK